MGIKVVTIKIIDRPSETEAIAQELRRYLLHNTPALVWDNCGEGSPEQPRRLEAAFPGEWRQACVVATGKTINLSEVTL